MPWHKKVAHNESPARLLKLFSESNNRSQSKKVHITMPWKALQTQHSAIYNWQGYRSGYGEGRQLLGNSYGINFYVSSDDFSKVWAVFPIPPQKCYCLLPTWLCLCGTYEVMLAHRTKHNDIFKLLVIMFQCSAQFSFETCSGWWVQRLFCPHL